jgi:hypothetical protein
MADILITERQLALITKEQKSQNPQVIEESSWYNTVGDIVGIFDPTGLVDFANGISYFTQGDHLFGILSLIAAIPLIGKVTGKPVLTAVKLGGGASKGLKVAMNLAKAGKAAEAGSVLTKLAKDPGVIGKFLQSGKSWAPKVAQKVELLPNGVLKGFKNTILDYLKLFENVGAKSSKFKREVGLLAKNITKVAKPAENIKALQNMLKNEKVFTGLTKKGPLSKIFLGGAPRLFGNREMRILMRRTKFWLGFLDYIGVANFVGPDELAEKMGERNIQRKLDEYSRTPQGIKNAEYDFGNSQYQGEMTSQSSSSMNMPSSSTDSDPIQGFMSDIFGGQLKNAAMLAI